MAYIVNRKAFIAWSQGILLDRDASGQCVVGDNIAHEQAEAAMDRGEEITLTVGGYAVSTMRLTDAGYVEKAIRASKARGGK